MNSLRRVVVAMMIVTTLMSLFLLLDFVVVGLVSLAILVFNPRVATQVVDSGVSFLLILEALIVIPPTIMYLIKGDKSNGS